MSFPMHATLLLFALSNKDVRYLINIYTINTFFGEHADMKVTSIAEKKYTTHQFAMFTTNPFQSNVITVCIFILDHAPLK